MSTPVSTSSTDSQMHNNIMAAGSKDRPPMLGPGRYSQWRSRFLRYIDTKNNGEGLKKCILNGPYVPTSVLIQAVPEAEGRPAVQQHTAIETILNMTPENKEHFQSEKEAIFLLLTGIGDEIYSTVDACNTTNEMWIAIERLQQGESLNVQDVKTNLFWEFGKFTSRDGESMESYYSRFYKLMNELTRNNLQVTTMQVNVQFLQQLQPEWSRFVTLVKQSEKIDIISYHRLFDILKQLLNEGYGQYAKEISEAKRLKTTRNTRKSDMSNKLKQGVPLLAEQADWLEDMEERLMEQELDAHYSYHAKIQEVSPEESSSTVSIGKRRMIAESTPDSSNICTNDNQVDQNAAECVDERAALANLTLDTEENKTILKQLKKANASLTQELEKCKTNLDETNSALGEAISCRDSCLIALQNKQNEFEKYKAFNDRTIDYEILQTKLNETLGLLALKDIEIKEGLKTKAYEISVVNQKHDELVKKSLLTKSQLEGYLKENTKVISDLKVKEDKDIDKMIEMDKQLKFLNEIVYTRNQSIQTIHMLAPKCSTYNGRPTFANPRYLKKAQSEKPCLYEIPYDTSDPANRFAPDREETMTLDNESRSKLNKDYVKPYDYTKQNSLYEIFKAPSLEYLYQLERGKEVRNTMWRKPFVRTKPNIAKNVAFLPVSESISKSRQVFNDMTFNINQFREIVDQTWFKHTSDCFRVPTAHDMELLIKTFLMPLSIKSQNDSFRFEHELKTEMHEDFEYVKSLEKEIDELESEKADFSNIDKTTAVCKENASNVFRKEREQYHEIQDLKAQMQDKNMVINELKKLILVTKGKSVETQFDKPSVLRQPNALWIPKQSVLGKPNPFSNSPEMRSFQTNQSVNKTNASEWNTNPHVSKSTGVNHTTSVSRPNLLERHDASTKNLRSDSRKCHDQTGLLRRRPQSQSFLGWSQFCDANLEVAFQEIYWFCEIPRKRFLTASPTQAWLWNRNLSHLNFDYITLLSKKDIVTGLPKLKYVKDQLCSSCEMSKAKRSSFKSKFQRKAEFASHGLM
ncbi:retrovirus-related pol polyprotein from transposon TNT 1-94, partial [Tanacetum coccineum]